jgi:hypothetical protein
MINVDGGNKVEFKFILNELTIRNNQDFEDIRSYFFEEGAILLRDQLEMR